MKYLPPELWDLIFLNLIPKLGIRQILITHYGGYPELQYYQAEDEDLQKAVQVLGYERNLLFKNSHLDYWRVLISNVTWTLRSFVRSYGFNPGWTSQLDRLWELCEIFEARASTIVVVADNPTAFHMCEEHMPEPSITQIAADAILTMTWRLRGLQRVLFHVDIERSFYNQPRLGGWVDSEVYGTFWEFFHQLLFNNYSHLARDDYPQHLLFRKWREELKSFGIDVRVLVRWTEGFLEPGGVPLLTEDVTMLWDDLDPLEGTTMYNLQDQWVYVNRAIERAHGKYMKSLEPD